MEDNMEFHYGYEVSYRVKTLSSHFFDLMLVYASIYEP